MVASKMDNDLIFASINRSSGGDYSKNSEGNEMLDS